MAIPAIIAGILGTLGYSASNVAVSNILAKLGRAAGSDWRKLIDDLQQVINENTQMLSDFKTKSETEKANIISSLLNGSGLGARAVSLQRAYDAYVKQDKELTKKVTDQNAEAQKRLNYADQKYSAAQSGLLGAAEALMEKPENARKYSVNDPSQNVNGGLQGGK